jgi:TM2 domain-containing membrane protein YozV
MRSSLAQRVAWAAAVAVILAPFGVLHAEEAAEEEKKPAAATEEAKPADQSEEEPAGAAAAPKGKRKSPAIAGGLAFFPGVVVHGAGHMYAGSWMKGLGLLAIEGAALGIGITTVTQNYGEIEKVINGTQNGSIPTDVGAAWQALGVGLVCSMAFLWTWFDDMAGAPIAANEYNRLAEEREGQAQLKFMPTGDGAVLALVRRF